MAADKIQFTIFGKDAYSGALGKFGKGMAAAGRVAKTASKAITAATVAVGGLTLKVAGGIDQQVKFANRLGVNVQQLTAMQHAASMSGINIEQFNMATQRMTRRVAEATQNLGEGKGALIELGIDAKKFSQLPLDDKMAELADSLGGVTNESDKLRLAFKLFDSEGTSMLQMLNNGSEAMRAQAADAKFLGTVISDELGAKSEQLTDSFTRTKSSLSGLGNSMVNLLGPALSRLLDGITNFVANSRAQFVSFLKTALTMAVTVVEIFKQLKSNFKSDLDISKFLERMVTNMVENIPNVALAALGMAKAFAESLIVGLQAVIKIAFDFGMNLGTAIRMGFQGESFSESFGKLMSDSLIKRFNEVKEKGSAIATETSDLLSFAFSEMGGNIGEGLGINLDLASEKAKGVVENLLSFGETAATVIEETGTRQSELMVALNEGQTTFMQGLQENSKAFSDSLFSTINAGVDATSSAIASTLLEGASLAKAMKQIAKQIIKDILTAFIKMQIQRAIFGKVNLARATAEAGANGVASWAGAPWPINAAAPAFGAAMASAAAAFGVVGAAHGGLDNVPNEATYLLQAGERVLSPNQNADLTSFLSNPRGVANENAPQTAGALQTESPIAVYVDAINIEVLPNATNADAFFDMDQDDLVKMLGDPIIEALDQLDNIGKRPAFIERTGLV